jgi:hypothetical protein
MNGIRYTPLINGAMHSWSNLVVAITGVQVPELIRYRTRMNKRWKIFTVPDKNL